MKKNCMNCIHLEYVDDTSYETQDGGYCCNKRQYDGHSDENQHLHLLNDPGYRDKSKKCFEGKKPE